MPSDTDSYVVGQKKRRWRSRSPSYSPPRNITYLDTQDGDPYYIEEVMIKLNKKCREYSVLEADFHKYRETIGEFISEKDEKTAALDGKVKNLEKTVRELVAKLAKKCKEKNVLEKEFQNFKEYSYEVISKGDEKIEKMQSIIAVDQLFDIVNLAERYQLPTLMKELEAQMQIIEVKSIDNIYS